MKLNGLRFTMPDNHGAPTVELGWLDALKKIEVICLGDVTKSMPYLNKSFRPVTETISEASGITVAANELLHLKLAIQYIEKSGKELAFCSELRQGAEALRAVATFASQKAVQSLKKLNLADADGQFPQHLSWTDRVTAARSDCNCLYVEKNAELLANNATIGLYNQYAIVANAASAMSQVLFEATKNQEHLGASTRPFHNGIVRRLKHATSSSERQHDAYVQRRV